MMDERRQPLGRPAAQAMGHHCVHRPPIISQDKVEAFEESTDFAIARKAGLARKGRGIGISDLNTRIDGVARAHGERIGAHNAVARLVAPDVHQASCARFLTAEGKAAMDMENMRWFSHATPDRAAGRSQPDSRVRRALAHGPHQAR